MAQSAIGERDEALKALERAVQRRALGLTGYSVAMDPVFAPIRGDPRFTAVLRGMGLPQSAFTAR